MYFPQNNPVRLHSNTYQVVLQHTNWLDIIWMNRVPRIGRVFHVLKSVPCFVRDCPIQFIFPGFSNLMILWSLFNVPHVFLTIIQNFPGFSGFPYRSLLCFHIFVYISGVAGDFDFCQSTVKNLLCDRQFTQSLIQDHQTKLRWDLLSTDHIG